MKNFSLLNPTSKSEALGLLPESFDDAKRSRLVGFCFFLRCSAELSPQTDVQGCGSECFNGAVQTKADEGHTARNPTRTDSDHCFDDVPGDGERFKAKASSKQRDSGLD